MVRPQTKGLQFRSFTRALKRLRGDEALTATYDAMPPEVGNALRYGTIVTGGWYPVPWYCELHAAAQRATGEGAELSRAIAKDAVQDDFRGVYRLITLALSPQLIFKLSPKLVSLYYDTGRVVIEDAEHGFVRARLEGFDDFDHNLWEDMIGGSTGVLELAGAKNMTVRIVAGGKDFDPDMTFEVRWT